MTFLTARTALQAVGLNRNYAAVTPLVKRGCAGLTKGTCSAALMPERLAGAIGFGGLGMQSDEFAQERFALIALACAEQVA